MKSINEILTQIANIAMDLSILNFKAMSICQKIGFNGFKRWHKKYASEYYDVVVCLELKAFDYYSVKLETTGGKIEYEPKTIIYHFQMFKEKAERYIAELGELNKEFVALTGFDAPKSDCLKCLILKQIEKCNRMVNRYKSIGSEATGLHDLHVYDDDLHLKLKEAENVRNARSIK